MQSAEEITFVDSDDLFDKVSNNDIVFVNGIEGVIPSMSISYGENVDIFVREGTQMEAVKFKLTVKHTHRGI